MTPTKYEELCSALDKTEGIKAKFKKLFIERFSNFMNCPPECVEIAIDEVATSLNPITYKAELKFKVTTETNEVILCVHGITLKHHLDKAPDCQYVGSYKGKDVLFASNPSPIFFDILKDLQKPLISED